MPRPMALGLPTLLAAAALAATLAPPAAADEEAPRLVVFELFNDSGIPGG